MAKFETWIGVGIGVSFALVLSGCRQHSPQTNEAVKPIAVQQAPPTPIETKREESGGPAWDPAWDAFIERSLPAEMLSAEVPRDVRRFCPRFFEMGDTDKRTYWAYFFQALAAAEAGLNAKTNVLHKGAQVLTDHVSGQKIRSEGLLQLTYEDQERYGCDFDWKADRQLPLKDPRKTILKPENNLACGIHILNEQIISHHKPLFAGSSYWSTLRPGTVSYRVFVRQMTNPPVACGWQERRAHAGAGHPQNARNGMRSTATARP